MLVDYSKPNGEKQPNTWIITRKGGKCSYGEEESVAKDKEGSSDLGDYV